MRKIWLVLTLAPLVAGAVEIDGVVARVGSETILRSEVFSEMQRMGERDGSRFVEVRNDLIDRKLILKAAAASQMTMQEWVVENRVREIINKAFDGDRNRLIETLGKQKLSYPEWYQRLKEDLIVGAMRWNVVDKNVTASPADMRAEYAAHPEKYASNSCVTVSVIMLKPEEKATRETVTERLKNETFEQLGAKRYQDVQAKEVFQEEICRELDAMPKGTVSHWIEIDGWNFLLHKEDERAGRQLSFAEAYELIEANVREAKAKRIYTEWLERLRAETYIKVF